MIPAAEERGGRQTRLCLFVALAALVPRAGYVAYVKTSGSVLLESDMLAYDEAGRCMARSEPLPKKWYFNGYHPLSGSTYYPPGYPYFLALVYRIFGYGHWAPLLGQALLGAGSAVLLFWIGRQLVSDRVGLLAGLSFGLYPPLVYYSGVLLTETLYVFLVLAWVWLLLRIGCRMGVAFCAGVLLGLASITRAPMLLGILLALPAFWYVHRSLRLALRLSLIHACGAAIVVLPVAIRNYEIHHELVLVSTNGPPTFYFGHVVKNMDVPIPKGMNDRAVREWTRRENALYLRRHFFTYLWELPDYYAAVLIAGVYWPATGYTRELLRKADFLLWNLFFLPFGLCGFLLWRRLPRESVYLLLIIAIHLVVPAIASPFPRYRVPMFPVFALLSWVAIATLCARERD